MGGAGDPGVPLPAGLENGFNPSQNQMVTMLSADESAVVAFKDADPAGANTIDVFYVETLNGGALFGTRGPATLGQSVNGTKRIGPFPDAANAGVGNGDTSTIRSHAESLP